MYGLTVLQTEHAQSVSIHPNSQVAPAAKEWGALLYATVTLQRNEPQSSAALRMEVDHHSLLPELRWLCPLLYGLRVRHNELHSMRNRRGRESCLCIKA